MMLLAENHIAGIGRLLEDSTRFLLERLDANGSVYPFIDTKFDIPTGKDFDDSEDFRRKDHIYGWIQGRGLEALAGAAEYFERIGNIALAARIDQVLAPLAEALENFRLRIGRLSFCMDLQGRSRFAATEAYNYTDLFYAKGLLAAGMRLKNTDLSGKGEVLLREVINSIEERTFQSDQHIFDPANRGGHTAGKYAQGPLMIALGGTALLNDRTTAIRLMETILKNHFNTGKFSGLEEYDFVEAVDEDGQPWREKDGAILCDPGHALEFVGLACKNLLQTDDFPQEYLQQLFRLFKKMFDLGFQENSGIMKGYDLCRRRALDTNSPWWSLPEAIRAGVLLMKLYPAGGEELSIRVDLMLKNFFTVFTAQGTYGFAVQTCDKNGKVIRVIPAVPDADPLYHTNLSLIDVIQNLQKG
ncbi:MAG: AGE family epimerase/isomerase [Lentisphaeria bacterium]|nr:AGE family epimerase/isomerase [Lentisphaeria bacterium]